MSVAINRTQLPTTTAPTTAKPSRLQEFRSDLGLTKLSRSYQSDKATFLAPAAGALTGTGFGVWFGGGRDVGTMAIGAAAGLTSALTTRHTRTMAGAAVIGAASGAAVAAAASGIYFRSGQTAAMGALAGAVVGGISAISAFGARKALN